MTFVTFKTSAETLHFSSSIKGPSTWVGISDIANEGSYINYYGRSVYVGSLLNWHPGQPDNGFLFGNEDCIHVVSNTNMFNDAPCGSSIRAACMSESLIKLSSTSP